MPTDITSTIRLLIVDDHEMIRVGLVHLLSDFPAVEVVGQAATVAEAIRQAGDLQPDVILLDIRLPDGVGHTACAPMREKAPRAKILVLTSYTDDATLFETIAAGVDGFLLKDVRAEELVDAIEQIYHGKTILAPAVTDRVLDRFRSDREDSPEQRVLSLSRQEKRVLAHVAEGKTNKEIGVAMGLSDKTVKNYLGNALDKLAVHRRSEAAALYARYAMHDAR